MSHEVAGLLSAYLDGELSEGERSAVGNHLEGCPDCRAELEALAGVEARLSGARRLTLPADILEGWERRLSRPSLRDLPRPALWVPAGALALVALWLVLARSAKEELPLEPLLAAHAHYSAGSPMPSGDLIAANFSSHVEDYYGRGD